MTSIFPVVIALRGKLQVWNITREVKVALMNDDDNDLTRLSNMYIIIITIPFFNVLYVFKKHNYNKNFLSI